jgi:hypothetical protein
MLVPHQFDTCEVREGHQTFLWLPNGTVKRRMTDRWIIGVSYNSSKTWPFIQNEITCGQESAAAGCLLLKSLCSLSTRSEWLFCLYWMSRMHLLTCFLHAEEAAWLAAKVPLPPHSDSVSLLVPLANSSREDGEEHQTFLSLQNGTIKVKMAAELLVFRYAGTTFRKQRNSKLVQCTVFVSFTTYMTSSAVPLLKFSYSVECTCRSAPILSISTMSTIHFWKNKSSHMWSFPCDQSINILFKC